VETGVNPRIDLVSSEAELEKRKEELIIAQDRVFRAENSLKALITKDTASPLWNSHIIPTEVLDLNSYDLDFEGALAEAHKKRPEYQILQQQFAMQALDRRYYLNQGLPQVDLSTKYSMRGSAGTPVDKNILPQFWGSYGQNINNMLSGSWATVRLGVDISWQIAPHITAKKLQKIKLQESQLQKDLDQLNQSVQIELLNAFNTLRTSASRIRSARASLANAERQLNAEEDRFKTGLSSNFLVLTRQNDLSEAKNRLILALTDYNKAVAELEKASGINIEKNNFDLLSDDLLD
jgi:HAE1 family hydrophobic/amphiphilic exporter-1